MKIKSITLILLLSVTSLFAQEKTPENAGPEKLVPSSAILFAETARIDSFIPVIKYFITNFSSPDSEGALTWCENFKAKTGIDPLDSVSLSKADIDVTRSAYLAYLQAGSNADKILIFIPVKNEKSFPMKFVEILKKYNKDKKDVNLNPAIAPYKKYPIYQIQKDIFFTPVDGFLVLASSSEIIAGVIDRKLDEKGGQSLGDDPTFLDYRDKNRQCTDVRVYIKKEFLDETYASRIEKKAAEEKQNGDGLNDSESGDAITPNGGEGDVEKMPDEGAGTTAVQKPVPPDFSYLKYMGLGLKKDDEQISVHFGISLNEDLPATKVMTSIFKPGKPRDLLPVSNPLAYYYISFDLSAFNEWCNRGEAGSEHICDQYKKALKSVSEALSINVEKDFIPYFAGYVNVAARKAKIAGTLDNFVFKLPMTDEGKCKAFWKTLKSSFEKQYAGVQKFGEEKIDAMPSFWFKDKTGNKISVIAHQKNIYLGNNTEFLRLSLDTKGGDFFQNTQIDCLKNLDDNMFLVSYLKVDNESYMKALLMLLTYNAGPQVSGMVNRINTITLVGNRIDTFFSLYLTVTLQPQMQPAK